MGRPRVTARWSRADMGFARSSGRTCAGRAGACPDVGIASSCGTGSARAAWVRSASSGARAGLGRARSGACFLTATRTCSPGCASGLGRRRRVRAFVGSAFAGCPWGAIAIRFRGRPSRRCRAFLGRPCRSSFALVGSACRSAADAAPDGAFLEPACPGLERTAAAGFRSRGGTVDGLGRAASGLGSTTADRRAFLERARSGWLGRRAKDRRARRSRRAIVVGARHSPGRALSGSTTVEQSDGAGGAGASRALVGSGAGRARHKLH